MATTPNLKKFLDESGVLDKFCTNLKNHGKIIDFEEFVSIAKKNRTESDGGLFAFVWAATPEGFYFWNKVDALWQKYYNRCLKNE